MEASGPLLIAGVCTAEQVSTAASALMYPQDPGLHTTPWGRDLHLPAPPTVTCSTTNASGCHPPCPSPCYSFKRDLYRDLPFREYTIMQRPSVQLATSGQDLGDALVGGFISIGTLVGEVKPFQFHKLPSSNYFRKYPAAVTSSRTGGDDKDVPSRGRRWHRLDAAVLD